MFFLFYELPCAPPRRSADGRASAAARYMHQRGWADDGSYVSAAAVAPPTVTERAMSFWRVHGQIDPELTQVLTAFVRSLPPDAAAKAQGVAEDMCEEFFPGWTRTARAPAKAPSATNAPAIILASCALTYVLSPLREAARVERVPQPFHVLVHFVGCFAVVFVCSLLF